jgi:hypothetical protein
MLLLESNMLETLANFAVRGNIRKDFRSVALTTRPRLHPDDCD